MKPSKVVVSSSSVNRAKIDHLKTSNSDYTEYYKVCCRRLCDSKEAVPYLLSRGISLESAISCGTGFDSNSDPANNPGETSTSIYPKVDFIEVSKDINVSAIDAIIPEVTLYVKPKIM